MADATSDPPLHVTVALFASYLHPLCHSQGSGISLAKRQSFDHLIPAIHCVRWTCNLLCMGFGWFVTGASVTKKGMQKLEFFIQLSHNKYLL